MKCFIIMPYAPSFEDTLDCIRRAVQAASVPAHPVEAVRLDDHQIAGRITERLEHALRDCDLCIADISPCDLSHPEHRNPNVMWEIGYAMALGKRPILVSHGEFPLPFDLQDVEHIRYDRARLNRTLEERLTKAVRDTVQHISARGPTRTEPVAHIDLAHALVQALAASPDFVKMLGASLPRQAPSEIAVGLRTSELIGRWTEELTGSCAYVAEVNGQLIAPYCFGGDDELSGVYFDWRPMNGWYYAKYRWRHAPISGFSFLRPVSRDLMSGAWWYEGEALNDPANVPDPASGYTSSWRRSTETTFPAWASELIEQVRAKGIERVLGQFGTKH